MSQRRPLLEGAEEAAGRLPMSLSMRRCSLVGFFVGAAASLAPVTLASSLWPPVGSARARREASEQVPARNSDESTWAASGRNSGSGVAS